MITFFTSLVQSILSCLKNRQQHVILIADADISTVINQQKLSPFAFALQKKWEIENVKAKIVLRTSGDGNGYDFSIAPLLLFFVRIKVKPTVAWKFILAMLKPKILVAIDWDMALNNACNAKKIKLYYLQHGVIVADHRYFGKNVLQYLSTEDLPYGFLTWDEVSAKNFNHLCKTFIIGNQYNNAFFENIFLHWFKKDEAALALNNLIKPVLLFTLTWGQQHNFFMPQHMVEVIKQTIHNYTWIIRLHPVFYMEEKNRNEFEYFLKQNFATEEITKIFWKEFNTLPLPLILAKTKVHLTFDSSVVIEAAQFGITSLILNDNLIKNDPKGENNPAYGGPSYYKQEREAGYAQVYEPGMDIKEWIAEQKIKRPLADIKGNDKEWKKFIADTSTPYNINQN